MESYSIIDADGHVRESLSGMREFLEPRWQRRDGRIHDQPRWLRISPRFKFRCEGFATQLRQPVHVQREAIIFFVQHPGAPRRQPQNSRTAESPMRREHGTTFPQISFRHRNLGIWNRNSRQSAQPVRLNVKSKQ